MDPGSQIFGKTTRLGVDVNHKLVVSDERPMVIKYRRGSGLLLISFWAVAVQMDGTLAVDLS